MKTNTDSFGNTLPKPIFKPKNNEEICKALTISTFLFSCISAMNKGNTVEYNKDTKSALITDTNGLFSHISHS